MQRVTFRWKGGVMPDPAMSADPMLDAAHQPLFNQFWLTLFFVIPMVLVARAVVAGTRYSPILIIVVFGLAMGWLLVATGVSTPGLADFPMLGMIAQATIVALTASFFTGGQELRRLIAKQTDAMDGGVVYSTEPVFLGTGRTQLVFVTRAFFLLLGIEALTRLVLGTTPATALSRYYPLIAYMGLVVAMILIDHKAAIPDKKMYLRKGVLEMAGIVALLAGGHLIASVVRPWIALPQIFFVMLLSAGLGAVIHRWSHGPALRCLLFAGIPVVLAANFVIGGSRILEAFGLGGLNSVLAYGFFGQVFWMFGGIALLIFVGRSRSVRNIGPGMAGALSHAGLTGACTAGDFGETAEKRAPILINVPFFGHIFVFSILAISVEKGGLLVLPSAGIALGGILLTARALRGLSVAGGDDALEVRALMQFSFGWQLTAVFGGLLTLSLSGMEVGNSLMATSSALSHFGLFAAIQGGMAGDAATAVIPFIFAMPFLVHPLVFFLFGTAMEHRGEMRPRPITALTLIGILGVVAALWVL
jgi:hypothetical protein